MVRRAIKANRVKKFPPAQKLCWEGEERKNEVCKGHMCK